MMIARVLAVALLSVAGAVSLQAAPSLELSDAWVRAMPPGQRMTAAYLQIHNSGDLPVTVQGVSAASGMASLHETRVEEGRSMMRPVEELPIAPGQSVALEPGGLHIMLMGLASMPREGETLRICLQTSEGEACVDAPVQRSAVQASHKH